MIESFPSREHARRYFNADGFVVGTMRCEECEFEGDHIAEPTEIDVCPKCGSKNVHFEEDEK
jgi:Zn finger protein HypA/HybF involved in hydrogenase expression